MKNEDFCELIFRKTLLLEGELLNLLKKTPKIAPPPEKKGKKKKKNPKHLKCSLTRAKDESHKRVDSSSLFLSLTLCLSLSLCLSTTSWPWYRSGTFNINTKISNNLILHLLK